MRGRVCIVTGANTGIGRVTAVQLAARGAHVVLACRSEERAAPVAREIERAGRGRAEFLELDLGSLAAVRDAAQAFLARDLPLHVLVNNAGLAGQRGLTSDGFELTFGVNHLGPFLFATLLLDKLRQSAPARIVNVSSSSHYRARGIDREAVRRRTQTTTGMQEYQVSKLANVLFTKELARRLEGDGVGAYALHPGTVASDIWRGVPWPFRSLVKVFMRTNEQGAETPVFLSTANAGELESGGYYDDCAPRRPSRLARDPKLAQQLWQWSEAWCAPDS